MKELIEELDRPKGERLRQLNNLESSGMARVLVEAEDISLESLVVIEGHLKFEQNSSQKMWSTT